MKKWKVFGCVSLQPHGLCSPWNSSGQDTGVGSLSLSRGSSQPRDRTRESHIAGRFFNSWATREAHRKTTHLFLVLEIIQTNNKVFCVSMCLSVFMVSQSVQSLSRVWLFAAPCTEARQASLSITNSWSLLKLLSIMSATLSHYLILCRPLLLPPSIFPSIRVFSKESVLCIRWPKYWSFSFSISPSSEYSGLISFRID